MSIFSAPYRSFRRSFNRFFNTFFNFFFIGRVRPSVAADAARHLPLRVLLLLCAVVFNAIFICAVFPAACAAETAAFSMREQIDVPEGPARLAAWEALRARIWLRALARIQQEFIAKRHFALNFDEKNYSGIAALSHHIVIEQESRAHKTVTARLMATEQENTYLKRAEYLQELLPIVTHIVTETEQLLRHIDRHWPNVRLYLSRAEAGQSENTTQQKAKEAGEATADRDPSHQNVWDREDWDQEDWSKKDWDQEDWIHARDTLSALWLAYQSIHPTADGWFTKEEDLGHLEKACQAKKNDPNLLLLLAESHLVNKLHQQAVESASRTIALDDRLTRARYIRALAYWQLQQFALAENDLSLAIEHFPWDGEKEASLKPYLRARGALRMLLEKTDGMCADFVRACQLGDCDGLRNARARQQCITP